MIYNLGSLNIDYVYDVDNFVKAGETISSESMSVFPGGKGLNQSVAISRAGSQVIHGGKIGSGGDFLIGILKESGVDVSRIEKTDGTSGHAIIQVDKNGENCIMIFPGTNRQITAEYIDAFLADAKRGDILLMQNETNMLDYAFKTAREKEMRIAFNPSPFDDKIGELPLNYVDWWFCNETEAAMLFGSDDISEIKNRFLSLYPASSLVLTLGKNGSVFINKDNDIYQPIYKTAVVDTTAAGDTFTGYFLSSFINGKSYSGCMNIASKASSITVSRKGASKTIPFYDEITF